jgi:erythromycin esterase-like protein
MLTEIIKNVPNYNHDAENVLSTEQNAFIARNAEKYYRTMIKRGSASWNIRDKQIEATIQRLIKFHKKDTRIIV